MSLEESYCEECQTYFSTSTNYKFHMKLHQLVRAMEAEPVKVRVERPVLSETQKVGDYWMQECTKAQRRVIQLEEELERTKPGSVEEWVEKETEKVREFEETWDDTHVTFKEEPNQSYQQTTLEQEIGLEAQPQGMESPMKDSHWDVVKDITRQMTQPFLQSVPVTINQSHVEPVSKCAHNQGVRIGEVHQKDMELAKIFRGQCRICNVWLSFELIPARPVQGRN